MFLTFSWGMGPGLYAVVRSRALFTTPLDQQQTRARLATCAILHQQRLGFEGEQSQRSQASARLVYRI